MNFKQLKYYRNAKPILLTGLFFCALLIILTIHFGLSPSLIITTAASVLYWRLKRSRYYLNLYNAEIKYNALIKHFGQIVKYANDMIFLLDDEARITEVSDKACSMLGYSREELLAMSAIDLRPQELKINFKNFINNFPLDEGKIYNTEYLRKDGTRFHVEVSARSFYIEGKLYLQAISRDISDRLLKDEALRISEERYRALFENNPNPMWIYDVDTLEFITVNEAAVSHYGYSKEEFLSMTLLDIRPEDDIPKLLENISSRTEFLQDSRGWRHKKKDGSIISVEIFSYSLSVFGEKKTRLVTVKDVTEQTSVQDALNTEREQLLSIFGSIDEAIYVADMDTHEILYANEATKKIFGSHLIGKKCYHVLQGNSVPCSFCTNKIIKEMNYRPYFWESYNPVADRTYQIIDRVIKWTDGQDVRFELAVDITAKKEAEQILRESEERYRALVNKLPDFVLVLIDQKIVFVNDIALEMSGYSLYDLIGEPILKFINPIYRLFVLDKIKHYASGEEVGIFEIEVLFKNRKVRAVNVQSARITYNKIRATLIVLTDITERKKAEEKLRLLAQAVKSSSEGISISDLNSNLIFVNEAFTKIFGYDESELMGKHVDILRSKRNPQPLLTEIEKATINGGWTGELMNRKKDGTEFPILLSTSSVLNEKGFPYALVGITRDISQQKLAEKILIESEERYRNIFDYSPIGIYRTTPDGRILLANPALVDMLGYPSAEELKKINLNNSDYPRKDFLERIEKEGKIIGYEAAWLRYDGTKIFANENAKVISGDNGETLYYEGTVEDITEQKSIEEELQKYRLHLEELVDERTSELKISKERFKSLAEHTQDIIIRLSAKLEHIYVNPVFEKILGISSNAILGKTIREIGMPPKVVDELESVLLKVFETKELNKHEMQLPNKNWFDWSIIPEFDPEGNVITIVLNGRDITERINLEESIKNALENEKILNEMKTKFISTASHEFRTPLTTVLSSAELLERYGRKWDVDKYNEHIFNIKNSVDNLIQLVNDILTIGRTETGKMELNLKQLNFCEFCRAIIKEVTSLTTNKHEISFNYVTEQKYFYIDEKLLRFILVNLLTNAIKYSPNGGKICLETDYKADQLIIKISDEGIGISEKDRKSLFEPFQRGSNTQNIPGTGLGLSIVKKSVEILKGNIEIESNLNNGSTFTIFIPADLDYSN